MNYSPLLTHVYELMEKSRKDYGSLKKGEFHLHTPASHDYRITNGTTYKNVSLEAVIEKAVTEGYLTQEAKDAYLNDLDAFQSPDYLKHLRATTPFYDLKEYITYMLIAHRLYQNNIDFVVISDHNTIAGYPKLKAALDKYFKEHLKNNDLTRKCIHLFLGVEISCSEKNHLIAIFDSKSFERVNAYLKDIILNQEEGTYYTSQQVIDEITSKFTAITYIAHVNSSELYGNAAYNKKLFTSGNMTVFGLTNLEVREREYQRIEKYCHNARRKFGVICEGDSHELETIGTNNTWIKMSCIDFASLRKAFKDHAVNVFPVKPKRSDKFIKGMYVIPGSYGFLGANPGSKSNGFFIDFSRDLNCIIGGRGTGKSTILNVLETAFISEVDTLEKLQFISRHNQIFISFVCEEVEYILRFIPQTNDMERYYSIHRLFLDGSVKENSSGTYSLSKYWTELFRVLNSRNFEKVPEKESSVILNKMFRRGYSVNKLVSMIETGKIGDFIRETVLYGTEYNVTKTLVSAIKQIHPNGIRSYLKKQLKEMIVAKDNYQRLVDSQLNEFNQHPTVRDTLRIVHSPKLKDIDSYLRELLITMSGSENVEGTYLTWDDVARYMVLCINKFGYLEFLDHLFNRRFKEIDSHIPLASMLDHDELKIRTVDKHLEYITPVNRNRILSKVIIFLTNHRRLLEKSIEKYLEVLDDYSLEFNVNSKELHRTEKSLFLDIKDLSLGQKVVALLTFIFRFGHYINDNTPLIIDQPEDNLDNQYIFKNLVESLRQIKNTRQVILVTHSSTIVTNADAEQVIVMGSDNKKAWVESKGYPSDKVITKQIINNLEGGIQSFKHKMDMYTIILDQQLRS